MNKNKIYTYTSRDKVFTLKKGDLYCYNGDSALDWGIAEEDGEQVILCEDFPDVGICGNVLDGTAIPSMVVKFCEFVGETIEMAEVQKEIDEYIKTQK